MRGGPALLGEISLLTTEISPRRAGNFHINALKSAGTPRRASKSTLRTLTLIQTLILILTQILTLKPTSVDATIRSHFGCSYIEKEPNFLDNFSFHKLCVFMCRL